MIFLMILNITVITGFCQQSAVNSPAAAFEDIASKFGAASTTARLLTDNVEAWYARWYIISNAKKTIDATSFIVDRDVFGMALLGLLQKKAKEGVKIRFMIDARGAGDLAKKMKSQDYLQELVELPNVAIHVYNPLSSNVISLFLNPRNILCSNHDKIIIVDDEWSITGGRNIARNYFIDARDFPNDTYQDTDVLLRGKETAAKLKVAFDEEFDSHSVFNVKKDFFGNWVSRSSELELIRQLMEKYMLGMGLIDKSSLSDKALIESIEKFGGELSRYKNLQSYVTYRPFFGDRSCPAVILDKHSFKGTLNNITPAVVELIKSARSEIIIQNPYFVVTDEAMKALLEADSRGVKIIVQTNSAESSEKPFTLAFFVNEWEKLLLKLPNCRIFAFKGLGKLHSKVFVFDREIAIVSSYNMDPMSEQINSEIAVAFNSKSFAQRSALRILESIGNSVEYKMRIGKDGKPVPTFGPESHTAPEILKKLNMFYKLSFLRPLI